MPTLLATLSQITRLPTNIALNFMVSETMLKTTTSNLNPIIWKRIIIRFLLTNSPMPSQKSHDSAVGPDDIHYQMLKHLPPNAVNTLLEMLNNIWFAGNFPPSWRTSTVTPILKPAIDASDPNNNRPIASTSCLCKVVESMVKNRLVWFLVRNKLITPLQCGFRKQHSTTDHLVRLESFISEAFFNGNMPLPYLSTWKRPTIVPGSTVSWKTSTKQVCVVGSPALLKVS